MSTKIIAISVICSLIFCLAKSASIEKCLNRDSISCLQIQIYQTANHFFNKVSSNVFGVLNLSTVHQNLSYKSTNFDEQQDDRIIHAGSVEQRQILLEGYFGDKLKNLWSKLSVSWSKNGILQYLLMLVPKKLLQDVGEARDLPELPELPDLQGPGHKQSNDYAPLLIGFGVKVAALVLLAYMNIATIASKAILTGVVSLVISGFIAVKNFKETRSKGSMMMMKAPSYEMEVNPYLNNPYAKYHSSNSIAEEVVNGHIK